MTNEKQEAERLGMPDTRAHDKMQGDKLKSGGVPARPGTGNKSESKLDEDQVSDGQVGRGA